MSRSRNLSRILPDSTGIIPVANVQSGTIIQTLQAKKSDTFGTTSGNFVPVPGLSVTITPKAISNSFLIDVGMEVGANWWQTQGGYFGLQALVNGVNQNIGPTLGNGNNFWTLQWGADSGNTIYETIRWADSTILSLNTLSPITFNVLIATTSASYGIYVNRDYNGRAYGNSELTVMEIKA